MSTRSKGACAFSISREKKILRAKNQSRSKATTGSSRPSGSRRFTPPPARAPSSSSSRTRPAMPRVSSLLLLLLVVGVSVASLARADVSPTTSTARPRERGAQKTSTDADADAVAVADASPLSPSSSTTTTTVAPRPPRTTTAPPVSLPMIFPADEDGGGVGVAARYASHVPTPADEFALDEARPPHTRTLSPGVRHSPLRVLRFRSRRASTPFNSTPDPFQRHPPRRRRRPPPSRRVGRPKPPPRPSPPERSTCCAYYGYPFPYPYASYYSPYWPNEYPIYPTIGAGSPLWYPTIARGVSAPACLLAAPPECACYGPFSVARPWGFYCVLTSSTGTSSPPPPPPPPPFLGQPPPPFLGQPPPPFLGQPSPPSPPPGVNPPPIDEICGLPLMNETCNFDSCASEDRIRLLPIQYIEFDPVHATFDRRLDSRRSTD